MLVVVSDEAEMPAGVDYKILGQWDKPGSIQIPLMEFYPAKALIIGAEFIVFPEEGIGRGKIENEGKAAARGWKGRIIEAVP